MENLVKNNEFNFVLTAKDCQLKACSRECFERLIKLDRVKSLITSYRNGHPDRKNLLPAVTWNAVFSSENHEKYLADCTAKGLTPNKGTRNNMSMKPTGFLMLDFDHINEPVLLFEKIKSFMIESGIDINSILGLAHITPSGKGLRLVVKRELGKTIPEEMKEWSEFVGVYCDPSCKDKARLSFVPMQEDVLFYNPDLLFEMREDFPEDRIEGLTQSELHVSVEHEFDPLFNAKDETYNGFPLSSLVEMVEASLGGPPSEGTRHETLKTMAMHLRWVMNHDAKLMKKYIPTYGIPLCEFNALMEYMATNNNYDNMTELMESVIAGSKAQMPNSQHVDGNKAMESPSEISSEVEYLINLFRNDDMPQMPTLLPKPIELIVKTLPNKTKGYAAMASFPLIGLYLKNVKFHHHRDGAVEPVFLVMVVALSSTGKNDISRIMDFILEPIEIRTQESEKIIEEWRNQCKQLPQSASKPIKPQVVKQIVPDDLTKAVKFDLLKNAAPYRLFVYAPEMESLYNLNDGKQQCFWTDVCRCYDNEVIGQARVSTDAVEWRGHFRMNWISHTTPGRFVRAIIRSGSVTQGAFSRITVVKFPENNDDDDVFSEIGDIRDNDADALLLRSYLSRLEAVSDCTLKCPEAEEWHKKMNVLHSEYAKATKFRNYSSIYFRAIKSGFFRAVILWLMNGQKWTQEIANFATWSVNYDIWGKLQLFEGIIRKEFAEEINYMNGKSSKSDQLNMLPQSFTKEDLKEVRHALGMGITPKDISDSVAQLIKRRKITYNLETKRYERIY